MKNPCYRCPDRAAGCHDNCGAYLVWLEEVQQINAAARQDRELHGAITRLHMQSVKRAQAGGNKKRRR